LDVLKLTIDAAPFHRGENVDALNAQFRHVCTLAALAGPRSSEPFHLKTTDILSDRQEIPEWWQSKDGDWRGVRIPEPWFWRGGQMVSHDSFIRHVRPKLLGSNTSETSYILTQDGKPYGCERVFQSSFMRRGIVATLGYPIGPHALRRFTATTRYAFGWSLADVADYLGDQEKVVLRSYIDRTMAGILRDNLARVWSDSSLKNLRERLPKPNSVRPPLPTFQAMAALYRLHQGGEPPSRQVGERGADSPLNFS
jgi:hypothetical protein